VTAQSNIEVARTSSVVSVVDDFLFEGGDFRALWLISLPEEPPPDVRRVEDWYWFWSGPSGLALPLWARTAGIHDGIGSNSGHYPEHPLAEAAPLYKGENRRHKENITYRLKLHRKKTPEKRKEIREEAFSDRYAPPTKKRETTCFYLYNGHGCERLAWRLKRPPLPTGLKVGGKTQERTHNPGWPGRRFWWADEVDLSDWAKRHRQWVQLRLFVRPPAPISGGRRGPSRKSAEKSLRAAKESYYAAVEKLNLTYPGETAEQAANSLFNPEGENGRPSGLLWDALGEREGGIRQMLGAASKRNGPGMPTGDPAGVAEGYLRASAAKQLLMAAIEAITFEDEPKKALRKALKRAERYLVLSYLTDGVHHANKQLGRDPGLVAAGSVAGFLKGEEARRLAQGVVRLTTQIQDVDDALLFAIYTRTHTEPVGDLGKLLEDIRKDIRAITGNKGSIEVPVRGRRPAEVHSLDYAMVSEGGETSTLHDYAPAERTAEPETVAIEKDAEPARHAAALKALALCRRLMSGRTPVRYEAFVARTLYDKKFEDGRLVRMSDDEVAEMLGIPVGKFRNRLMDARKKLPQVRAALTDAGIDLGEVPGLGYTINPHERGALKDVPSEHEPGEVERFKASAERLERMGETRKPVAVRRRLATVHNPRIHRDRPPGWRSEAYIRAWYQSEESPELWKAPDSWAALGGYPTFATTFDGEPGKDGRTFSGSTRLPLFEGCDEDHVRRGSAPDLERYYAYNPLYDVCVAVRAPGRGRGYRDHRGSLRKPEAEEV
jgi:hypothetical protein